MIIPFLGKTVKEYRKNYLILLSQIIPICPICNEKCHHHCWYERKVRGLDPTIIIILRVKCPKCGSTHAILPDFLFPRGRYSGTIREATILDCEIKGKTQEAASENQAVETTRRWIKRYREITANIIAALRSVLARLVRYESAVIGSGFDQLKQMSVAIETALGHEINASGIFGKANILLNWGNTGVWI